MWTGSGPGEHRVLKNRVCEQGMRTGYENNPHGTVSGPKQKQRRCCNPPEPKKYAPGLQTKRVGEKGRSFKKSIAILVFQPGSHIYLYTCIPHPSCGPHRRCDFYFQSRPHPLTQATQCMTLSTDSQDKCWSKIISKPKDNKPILYKLW
jgi:hypothetical protein